MLNSVPAHSVYNSIPVPTSVVRVADLLRKFDEACKAASDLRADIARRMGVAHAREKPARDDTDVIIAREAARKIRYSE